MMREAEGSMRPTIVTSIVTLVVGLATFTTELRGRDGWRATRPDWLSSWVALPRIVKSPMLVWEKTGELIYMKKHKNTADILFIAYTLL
jgi:hypothetical protein